MDAQEIVRCSGCRMDHRADHFELDRLGRRRKTCLSCKAKRAASLKAHQCPECEKVFGRKWDLNTHIRTVHIKEKSFQCPECDYAAGQRGHLNIHIRTVHRGEKPFQCPECDKAFGLKQSLNIHVRTIHRGEKPHQCPECESVFGGKCNLVRHIKTVHRGEKPFQCPECEKVFGVKGNYSKHIKICTGKLKCSGGEYACMKVLDELQSEELIADYVHDSTHEGLSKYTGNNLLRFDFVLTHGDSELVIEYDGEQHTRPVNFGGMSDEKAAEAFEKLQEFDALKDAFCEDSLIPMLRIPHTEFERIPELIREFVCAEAPIP